MSSAGGQDKGNSVDAKCRDRDRVVAIDVDAELALIIAGNQQWDIAFDLGAADFTIVPKDSARKDEIFLDW